MGLFDKFFKGKSGTDAGNVWNNLNDSSTQAVRSYLERGHDAGANEFQNDPVLGQLFRSQQANIGEIGGDISKARGEEADLASRGYKLQPEDQEAYGQAAGNIARQFGQAEGNLAHALASRGLSNSGSATRSFMGSQGNKLEQLAQLQTNIADKRMQNNMQRLANTRDFMSNLMGQRAGMQGQAQNFALQGINQKNQFAQDKAAMGQGNLANQQAQANLTYQQQLATQSASPFKQFLGQALQHAGGMGYGPMGGALGGALGQGMGADNVSANTGATVGTGYMNTGIDIAKSAAGAPGGGGGNIQSASTKR